MLNTGCFFPNQYLYKFKFLLNSTLHTVKAFDLSCSKLYPSKKQPVSDGKLPQLINYLFIIGQIKSFESSIRSIKGRN